MPKSSSENNLSIKTLKKHDSETKTFYFLGEMNAVGDPEPVAVPKRDGSGEKVAAFKVRYRLESNVRRDIYEYITET